MDGAGRYDSASYSQLEKSFIVCTSPFVLVVSFDRLPVSALSCYGGISAETPNLDRLASTGVVFDAHVLENLDPNASAHAWWTGNYEHLTTTASSLPNLFDLLEANGVEYRVISCGPRASVPWPDREGIERHKIEEGDIHDHSFRRASEQLGVWRNEASNSPRLLWVHVPGFADPTDIATWGPFPPESGLDEETFRTLEQYTRDAQTWNQTQFEHWRALQRYRVTHWDGQIGKLADELRTLTANGTLIITAAHGEMPTFSSLLPECPAEQSISRVQTPFIIAGNSISEAVRRSELTQPVDFASTLLKILTDAPIPSDWPGRDLGEFWTTDPHAKFPWDREAAFFGGSAAGRFGVRTSDFHLAIEASGDEFWEDDAMLFQLPDDPHGIYNIARQQPEVVEQLIQEYREFRMAIEKNG